MAITTITNSMVSVNAIQGTLIADNAITTIHIASNAVESINIAENNVTTREIAANSVTVAQLADDSVESDKIADGVITTNHLNKAMISSQTEVTPVAGDFVLLGDTSDSNNLKKSALTLLLNSNVDLSTKLNLSGGTMTGALVVNTAGNGLPSVSLSHSNASADNFLITAGVPGTSNAGFSIRDVDAAVNRLVIDTSGNVGIGTTSPARALSTKSSSVTIGSFESTSASGGMIGFVDSNTTNDVTVRAGALGNDLVLQAGGSTRMHIDSSGNVGIGNTNPQHPLSVHLTNGQLAMFGSNGMNSPGQYAGIGLGQVLADNTTYQKVAIVAEGRNSGSYVSNLHFLVDTAADSGSAVLADSKMMISGANGYVGIGTAAPGDILHITNGDNAVDTRIRLQAFGQLPIWHTYYAAGTESSPTAPTSGTELSRFAVSTWDGNDYSQSAGQIRIVAEANHSSNVAPAYMAFDTNSTTRLATEKMRIDSAGNVGIGITTPNEGGFGANSNVLSIAGASQNEIGVLELISTDVTGANRIGEIRFGNLDAGSSFASNAGIRAIRDGADNSSAMSLWTTNAGTFHEVIRIKADKKVGLGTETPDARLDIEGMAAGEQALLITSPRNDALSNGLARINITDANCPFIGLQIDHAGTGAGLVCNGDLLIGASTAQDLNGSIGESPLQVTGAEPGLQLYGTGTGTYSHSGGIAFGSAGGGGADRDFFYMYAHPENWHVYNASGRAFYFPQGSNSVIAYASDERLKENIVDLNLGLTAINNLKPRRFDWKSDGQEDIGFVAQELKPHIPEAIQGTGADYVDGEDKHERDAKNLKIGNDKLIPVLVKAIQELSAELTAAKARITTLEG